MSDPTAMSVPAMRSSACVGLLRGFAQTAAIVAGFVALGLAGAAVAAALAARSGEPATLAYHGAMADRSAGGAAGAGRPPSAWLVDGYNTLHVALLRGTPREGAWWTREAREALLERVRRFDPGEAEVWVVFDGPDPREIADPGAPPDAARPARVVFAPSTDEWLLARARAARPGELAVVTADRRLAERARARGARVVPPAAFLARCGA